VSLAVVFPGSSSQAAGFEAPLEMLAACHGRIIERCEVLVRLRAHVATSGADEAACEAARGIMRYFDLAAVQHHADEEEDLFPALLESMAGSDAVCIRELADDLTREHRELERRWMAVRRWLARIEAGDPSAPESGEIEAFADAYTDHIAREEQHLLPMAARLLPDEELERIGRAMRLRRGVATG